MEFSTEGHANEPDYDLIIYCNKITIFNARSKNYKKLSSGGTIGYGKNRNGVNIRETEVKGIFITRLKNKNYKRIVDLILSLHEEFAKKKYFENSIHTSVGVLKVTYKNGETYSINDYGLKGTDRLIKLYSLIDDFRFSQKWK